MVFKRVLKGIGRLMLTTAVMCGVGLFLCSSEVKAAVSVNVTPDGKDYIITVSGDAGEIISSIDTVKLYKDSSGNNLLFEVNNITSEIDNDNRKFTITKGDFLNYVKKDSIDIGNSINIGKIDVDYTYNLASTEHTSSTGATSRENARNQQQKNSWQTLTKKA